MRRLLKRSPLKTSGMTCLGFFALVVMFILSFTPYANAQEPTNLAFKKEELIQYYNSGTYQKDIETIMAQAMHYLQDYIKQPKISHKKPAIVLDIDETSLSNYPNMVKLSFGGTHEQIAQAEDLGMDPAISPTLKLYRYAKAHQIAVFFITGRQEFERKSTVSNLKNVGYSDWDGLILRSVKEKHLPATTYKVAARKQLVQSGYDIIMNIGDQESDLRGTYTGKNFKLPNPYYLVP